TLTAMSQPLPRTIYIRPPTTYNIPQSPSNDTQPFQPPPLPFLLRTWTVTHSTLSMWRSARNVRITYTSLPPTSSNLQHMDDLVEYESLNGSGSVKTVQGIDTPSTLDDTSSWNWKGKGWLFFARSHWEVLGWGERPLEGGGEGELERWVVTWFEKTVFTEEGVDVYSDREVGCSEGLLAEVVEGLKGVEELKGLVGKLRRVESVLPWKKG
ncbi:hypothetical protein HK097_004783, partial [Rhizophlyctis rosea]